jgi:methylmalonyl-CoA mutase cobalamin-binding subunit
MVSGELREADTMIQRRLEEVVTATDTRLSHHDERISMLTTMLSDLQRQVNIPGSHSNPPDISIAAYQPPVAICKCELFIKARKMVQYV